jgi:hypothetical protein
MTLQHCPRCFPSSTPLRPMAPPPLNAQPSQTTFHQLPLPKPKNCRLPLAICFTMVGRWMPASYPQPAPWPQSRPHSLPPPLPASTASSAKPLPPPTAEKYTGHQRWCYGVTQTPPTSPGPAPAASQEATTSSATSVTTHLSTTPSQPTALAFPSSAHLWWRRNTLAPLPPPASPPTNGKFWPTWVTLNLRPRSSATTR